MLRDDGRCQPTTDGENEYIAIQQLVTNNDANNYNNWRLLIIILLLDVAIS